MKRFFHLCWCSILIFFGAVFLFGKNHFLLGSILTVAQWPLMIFAGIILYRKRKKGRKNIHKVLFALSLLLLVNLLYEQMRRIHLSPVSNTEQALDLLTYNLFFKNKQPQQIIDEIKQTDPDILLVQELTSSWDHKLNQQVYPSYPYRKTFVHNGTHGLGIFSKHPIESSHFFKNEAGLPFCQIVELNIKGKPLILLNTHLSSPAAAIENPDHFLGLYKQTDFQRNIQMYEVDLFLKEHHAGKAQIVAGDLNTMRIEPLYKNLRANWRDLYKKKGKGLGLNFPNVTSVPRPIITLDYILYRGNIKALEAKILPGSSSDHLAVWGRIEI